VIAALLDDLRSFVVPAQPPRGAPTGPSTPKLSSPTIEPAVLVGYDYLVRPGRHKPPSMLRPDRVCDQDAPSRMPPSSFREMALHQRDR
jgi:hypothetical protein